MESGQSKPTSTNFSAFLHGASSSQQITNTTLLSILFTLQRGLLRRSLLLGGSQLLLPNSKKTHLDSQHIGNLIQYFSNLADTLARMANNTCQEGKSIPPEKRSRFHMQASFETSQSFILQVVAYQAAAKGKTSHIQKNQTEQRRFGTSKPHKIASAYSCY